MNGSYNVIWSKVKQCFVVSAQGRSSSKQTGSSVTWKMATVLAVLALTVNTGGGITQAATNGQWTTAADAKGNFTAHIDTANIIGANGEKNTVIGDGNTVNTNNNDIMGDTNTLGIMSGGDYILGDGNVIASLKSSWIMGNDNKIFTKTTGYREATNSLIIGNRNTSTGEVNKTTIIGNDNKVNEYINNSIAIGSGMEFGIRSDDSVVIGNNTKNGGFPTPNGHMIGSNGSVVIGDSASNQSAYSVVIGSNAKMGDKYSSAGVSVVIGAYATIDDDSSNSILIGPSNSSFNYAKIGKDVDNAIAMGALVSIGDTSDQTIVIGNNASAGTNTPHGVALGGFSKLSDKTWFGTAVGYEAEVTGRSSIALGNEAKISKAGEKESKYSIALGYKSNVASGNERVTALGPEANIGSSANGSVAIGAKATVDKWASGGIALGTSSYITGSNNIAIGSGAKTATKPGNTSDSIALGNRTKVETGYSVAVGSNATIAERADSSSVFGYGAATSSKYSSVIGSKSKIGTGADYSFIGGAGSSIGDKVKWATIVGSQSKVDSAGATAIGYATAVEAGTGKSVTLGTNSRVNASDIVNNDTLTTFKKSLGDFYDKKWNISSADGDYGVISVGGSQKRRIINVAKGRISEDSSDAVNGSQLYHLAKELKTQIAGAGGKPKAGTNVSITEGTSTDGKKEYTINADNASVSGDHNFTITSNKDTATNITDYNIKLKDTITIGETKEGNHPIKIDGTTGQITGLTNTTLDAADFATAGRAATEEQLKAAMNNMSASTYKGWTISANGSGGTAVGSNNKVDFSGAKDVNQHQNIIVKQNGTNLTFDLNSTINIGNGNHKVSIDGDKATVQVGSGDTKISLNGQSGVANVGKLSIDGAKGDIVGLTNTTLEADDFAKVGRAATEEQLKSVSQQMMDNSLAVNQLGTKVNQLDTRIDKVGAGAAALAALHPLDFDADDKWDIAAGYGNYRGENAMALGAFYRPNEDTLFSVGGTVGNGDTMFNAGVSLKFGQGNTISTTRVAMAKEIKDLRREMEALKSAMLDSNAGRKVDTSKLQLFPDVPQNHWAYEYVATLAGNGIIKGYPNGNYDGNRPMTRYEFAAMLYRAMLEGATLSEAILAEFAPELERFTVETVHTDEAGNPTVERVRVAPQK